MCGMPGLMEPQQCSSGSPLSSLSSLTLTSSLPEELFIEVLGRLDSPFDIARAICSCKAFANIQDDIWKLACCKRWPFWAKVATAASTKWKRQYEILELRDKELLAVPSVQAITRLQTCVTPKHRMVLTEWLAEVSWDWCLESTVVFKAVSYLDHFLACNTMPLLSKFQLLGIACLRIAMVDTRGKLPAPETEVAEEAAVDQDPLAPERFAHVSDRTYTTEQVVEMTGQVELGLQDLVRECPNCKMFLRSLWYRAGIADVQVEAEMHIYTLASFLLQLSLLDLKCSAFTPSMLAAAGLSVACEVFAKETWPASLQQYSAYTVKDLQPCKDRLCHVQATAAAPHLRTCWRQHYESHAYDEFQCEWQKALRIMGAPCKLD